MIRDNLLLHFGRALFGLALAASIASAAASITNSLKGFAGNSTQPATQSAVTAAGFNFASTAAFSEDPSEPGTFVDPTIQFDSGGAHYGDLFSGDGGRNYVRTNDIDYANVNFTAEITFDAPDIDIQDFYYGMGSGNIAAFRTPDYTTQNSSVMFWGESEIATPTIDIFVNNEGNARDTFTDAPALGNGTHRVRLSYDRYKKSATFSFDLNYAGGAFTADVTPPAADVSALYGPAGWPTEPARIFFGGDDSIVVKDFQVTVTTAPITLFGDFNNSGTITSADWAILRTNQHTDLSALTENAAYLRGDMNGDLANNYADFAAFKQVYDDTHGAGSFAAMIAGVPEPSAMVLVLAAGLIASPTRRRRVNRR